MACWKNLRDRFAGGIWIKWKAGTGGSVFGVEEETEGEQYNQQANTRCFNSPVKEKMCELMR